MNMSCCEFKNSCILKEISVELIAIILRLNLKRWNIEFYYKMVVPVD